ncbi:MAG TPA: hypothetical protein VKC54_04575 [Patescibacteria group bacterium]|nr:hypothetical protein [Patescibacteria group bacterium]
MKERIPESEPEWETEVTPSGAIIHSRPISPDIMKQMPTTSRIYLAVGPIRLIVHSIKKILHPGEVIHY